MADYSKPGKADIKLKVSGMNCTHCKSAVEKALKGLRGVYNAEVELKAGEVKISYDATDVSLEDMKKAVREAGYEIIE